MPTSADFIEGSNISIGHLGIVAGAFDVLGITEVIDRAILKTRQHHLTHGQLVKAMVLNGLRFVERPLPISGVLRGQPSTGSSATA